MQQMNNILLASSAKNSASSSKALTQDTNSEDFSAALALVTSVSSPSTKPPVSQDVAVKSAKVEASTDDTNTDDEADINLIFAQIGMANEMKKAAAPGESLPLEADITVTDDADADSPSLLVDAPSQTDNSIVDGTFSDEMAKYAQPSNTGLGDNKLNVSTESEGSGAVAPKAAGQNTAQVTVPLLQQQASQQNAVDAESVEPQISAADVDALVAAVTVAETDTQGTSVDEPHLIDDAALLTGLRSEKFVKPPENHILPIEGEPVLGGKELGTTDIGAKAINVSTQPADKALAFQSMASQAVDNQTPIKAANASASDVLTTNSATAANTNDLNTLGTNVATNVSGTTAIDPSLTADTPSRAEISAGFLLKDAKLAVTLDAQQDSQVAALSSGSEETGSEFKPVEFKPVSSLHSLTTQVTNRQDIPQVQLSLRQGVETQNQMQEMIQRFSPVMKQQLVTMVSQGIQQAEIRLDPPELGHMLVKVQVHGDQTQVQFHVTQSQTRDIVEQAIPRLRELLQEQGMQLADSHVSHGDQGQRREGGFGEAGGSGSGNMDDFSAEELDLGLNQATSLNSGIDYYA
ncbi:flagellar hook-length control protein FliK [Shewanella xiamenensis]|uniref:flagellar hook-length control protein FliK n=1 Tax=Shewanella xiamenensis TaxID=332186 RepID=UPI00002934ED|nr:flagellar hook-length control protein FliK [Shewanella xiamenensis]MDH1625511.1 flagellar hook-length control protein FliK [Shewanella xiamenensis]MDV5245547.1 flagellar hook-length control protein FliK [Shewanella xiamenensis]PWH04373.1 flagellar hook-length control protein FliK [Shewanella xiamenensis]